MILVFNNQGGLISAFSKRADLAAFKKIFATNQPDVPYTVVETSMYCHYGCRSWSYSPLDSAANLLLEKLKKRENIVATKRNISNEERELQNMRDKVKAKEAAIKAEKNKIKKLLSSQVSSQVSSQAGLVDMSTTLQVKSEETSNL